MRAGPANHAERFETVGDLYYRDTGYLRPGKDEPAVTGRDSNSDENRERFEQWLVTRFFGCALDRIAELVIELESKYDD